MTRAMLCRSQSKASTPLRTSGRFFEVFQTRYVARGLMLDAERNVSAPPPNGRSAGATGTAVPAKRSAPTARQD